MQLKLYTNIRPYANTSTMRRLILHLVCQENLLCCSITLLAGNITIIGSLLFNSAILEPFLGRTSAATQNISSSLDQTKLTPQDKKEALAQGIALALQQREPQAAALLAAVALSVSNAAAINDGFSKVRKSRCLFWPKPSSFRMHMLLHTHVAD